LIGEYASLVRQGLEHLERGRLEKAEQTFRSALAMNPRDDQLLHLVGVAQLRQGRWEEAVHSVQRAISLTKRKADYHNTLGCALRELGRVEEAITSFGRALKLAPDAADARFNFGQALLQARRYSEAQALFGSVVAENPADVEALIGLARANWIAGEYAGAVAAMQRGVACLPHNRFVHFVLSELLIALGDFETGWREYLERPIRAQLLSQAGRSSDETQGMPRLASRLEGQTVKLHGEQGLGDQLFFLRFASELRARGAARIEVAVEPRLVGIVARSGVADDCFEAGPHLLRDPDWRLIGDLPYLLASNAPNLAPPLRLNPLDNRAAEMRSRLEGLARPLIGLAWRGGTPAGVGDPLALFKELPFKPFAELAAALPGTLLVLQRNPRQAELEALFACAPGRVADFSMLNDDLEGMLALLARVDDYIGVSNTNVHLHAGVGGRGKVLVTSDVEFRWMARGAESPWFPGYKVYRQAADRDWLTVFEQLRLDVGSTWANAVKKMGGAHEADHHQ
jgi:Flp pilus assembly protein TadD